MLYLAVPWCLFPRSQTSQVKLLRRQVGFIRGTSQFYNCRKKIFARVAKLSFQKIAFCLQDEEGKKICLIFYLAWAEEANLSDWFHTMERRIGRVKSWMKASTKLRRFLLRKIFLVGFEVEPGSTNGTPLASLAAFTVIISELCYLIYLIILTLTVSIF